MDKEDALNITVERGENMKNLKPNIINYTPVINITEIENIYIIYDNIRQLFFTIH
jgi:hypothetical protein